MCKKILMELLGLKGEEEIQGLIEILNTNSNAITLAKENATKNRKFLSKDDILSLDKVSIPGDSFFKREDSYDDKITKMIASLLDCGYYDVEELSSIMEHSPLAIQRAIEDAKENNSCYYLDWGNIIEAVVTTKKEEVNYQILENYIGYEISELSSSYIIDICEEIKDFIEDIVIDDNYSCWGTIKAYNETSKYSDIADIFASFVIGEITEDKFYDITAKIVVDITKDRLNEEKLDKLNVIAVYPICNSATLNLYSIEEEYVEVGLDKSSIEKCELIDYSHFNYNGEQFELAEFIKIN